MAKVKITLVKGLQRTLPNQRKTIKALGLGKISSSSIREDDASTRGMIRVVEHLVKVEEV